MNDSDHTTGPTPQQQPATQPRQPSPHRLEPAHYQQVSSDQHTLRAKGQRRIAFGLLWLLAGVLITTITLANAAHGGTYIVAFGPILYGIYQTVSGLRLYSKNSH